MIRLHHVPQARSFRILWLLLEMGEQPEVVIHSMLDRSLRSPDYLALSPAGRVPALEIDGRRLFESGAITEYLCETRAPQLGRAPGEVERADWLEWLHFAETIGQHLANLTQQHIVLREDHMRSPTVMRLEAKRLEKTVEVVERGLEARFSAALRLFRRGCAGGLWRHDGAPLRAFRRLSLRFPLAAPLRNAPRLPPRAGGRWRGRNLYPRFL